jgi:hypothetical protein
LSTTLSKIWLSVGPFFRSFDHNSLVSRPFLARKVSNRSSHYVLQNGPGVVSLIQLSVWSTVRSNLGQTSVNPSQTWSTLVKPWEMCPGPSSWEYLMWRGFVGSCWLGPGCPVLRADTRENPVGKNGVMTSSFLFVKNYCTFSKKIWG